MATIAVPLAAVALFGSCPTDTVDSAGTGRAVLAHRADAVTHAIAGD